MHERLRQSLPRERRGAAAMPRYRMVRQGDGGRAGEPNTPPLVYITILYYKTDKRNIWDTLITPEESHQNPAKVVAEPCASSSIQECARIPALQGVGRVTADKRWSTTAAESTVVTVRFHSRAREALLTVITKHALGPRLM